MANEKTIAKKQEAVNSLAQEIKEAKVVLLTDYRGITVTDVTKLRADLRNVNAEYRVIKNNIIKRALDANGESALDEALEGPVALVMSTEDYLEPSKVIYNFTKDHDFYKIKPWLESLNLGYKFNFFKGCDGHPSAEILLIGEVY